jgi:hypothetical protein
MHGNGLALKHKKPMNEKFYEKHTWIISLIIGVMVLVDAIPHTFGINTDPALVQVIGGQAIYETKISNAIRYGSSVLILLIKVFFGRGFTQQYM